jgi:hypothetical protein
LAAIRYLEDTVRRTVGLQALALRYGIFYGPGTGFAKDWLDCRARPPRDVSRRLEMKTAALLRTDQLSEYLSSAGKRTL